MNILIYINQHFIINVEVIMIIICYISLRQMINTIMVTKNRTYVN